LLTSCLAAAAFAQVKPKLTVPKVESKLKLDLTIAELKVSEHPEISGKFSGTHSAQPVLKKIKGLGIGKFMVETTAFDNSGSPVQTCKKEISIDDPKTELIEHPALRCDITDEKKARSVVLWETKVDTNNQIDENNENDNLIQVIYPPNLYVKTPTFTADFKTIEVKYGNNCLGTAAFNIPLEVRFYKNGVLDKPSTLVVGQKFPAIKGKTASMMSFDIAKYTLGKDPQKDNSIVVEIVNTSKESYTNDNKMTIGLKANAQLFPPSTNPCQAIQLPAGTVQVTGVR